MSFRLSAINVDKQPAIFADGTISQGTTSKLRRLLSSTEIEPYTVVYFNSPGGDLDEGMKLGALIREHKLSTSIGKHGISYNTIGTSMETADQGGCYSACTLAFLGGVERTAGPPFNPGQYGVHRFYHGNGQSSPDDLGEGQIGSAIIVEYVRSMGADPAFLTEMAQAGPEGINVLTLAKMDALKITTPTSPLTGAPVSATRWEVVAASGSVTARGTVKYVQDTHFIEFACVNKHLTMTIEYHPPDSRRKNPSDFGTPPEFFNVLGPPEFVLFIDFEAVDGRDLKVLKEPYATASGRIAVVLGLTPHVTSLLQHAAKISIRFDQNGGSVNPGWGFDADFADGRQMVFNFFETCR